MAPLIYFWLILLSVVSIWIFYFAGIKNAIALDVISGEIFWTGILAHLILGYLIGRVALDLKNLSGDAGQLQAIFYIVLLATSISYGNSFILVTVGKYANMPEMVSFFRQSGYSVWRHIYTLA